MKTLILPGLRKINRPNILEYKEDKKMSLDFFKITCGLTKKEANLAKKTITIPDGNQSWISRLDRGITIILETKKDQDYYLSYSVCPKENFWHDIEKRWNAIGFNYPFSDKKFFVSSVYYYLDIDLKNLEYVKEYTNLLYKSAWCIEEADNNSKNDYFQKFLQMSTMDGRIIQCLKPEYLTKNKDSLEIENFDMYDNDLIMNIWFVKSLQIQKLMQSFNIHSHPVEKQLAFFIKNEDILIQDTLQSMYIPGKYHSKDFVENHIKNDSSLTHKEQDKLIRFFNGFNDGRSTNEPKEDLEKTLDYFIQNNINLAALSSDFKEDDELPSIHELVAKRLYNSELYENLDESILF